MSRIRQLFDEAMDLPAGEWEAFLDRSGADAAAREQVLRLLRASAAQTGFLERPLLDPSAAQVFPPLHAGRQLGPWVLDSEIGHGGMGVVYRAHRRDGTFEKTVAIKAAPLGIPQESFRRERQILAKLEHPNIARLLDGGADATSGVLYLVMELVDGERIDDYARRLNLSTRARIALLFPVMDAVRYAHRNLVVHRDLKPANILVTAAGVPKLLDFGIAKVFDPDSGASPSAAETRMMAMTLDYASPEQIRGETVGTASDVYSLGVVAFELLSRGAKPYPRASGEGATVANKMRAILEDDPQLASWAAAATPVAKDLSGDLDRILEKALAKDLAERYQTIDEFRGDLEAYLRGRPVSARAGGFWYRTRKYLRRHWLPVGAAAAVLLSSTIGAAAFLQQARVAEERRQAAEDANRKTQALLREKEQLLAEQIRLRTQADERLRRSERLANSLVFEVHDAMNNLQGASESRLRIVSKTLPELESLLRESPGDVKIQRSLAAAYERVGDLAGGVHGEGRQGSMGGAEYYAKALALVRKDPEKNPSRLVMLLAKNSMFVFGQQHYRDAEALLTEAEGELPAIGDAGLTAEVRFNLCQVRVVSGSPGASDACRKAVDLLGRTASGKGSETRSQRAASFQRLAILAHGRGEIANAIRLLRAGIQDTTQLIKEYPDQADYKRNLGIMLGHYGRWNELAGSSADAVEAYAEALKVCELVRAADPKQNSLGLNHAWTAMRYASALQAKGRIAEARKSARDSIEMFEDLLRAPKAGFIEHNEYAMRLMQCPFADLCDVRKALQLAEKAVQMSGGKSAFALDTAANAYFRNGDSARAVETERLALARSAGLPKSARDEIEANQKRFEAAAASAGK